MKNTNLRKIWENLEKLKFKLFLGKFLLKIELSEIPSFFYNNFFHLGDVPCVPWGCRCKMICESASCQTSDRSPTPNFGKSRRDPQAVEKLKFSFGFFFLNSFQWVIFQQKWKSINARHAQIFIISLYSFSSIISFIVSLFNVVLY